MTKEGDIEIMGVQSDHRISIPKGFLEHLGLNNGDKVAIVCKEAGIEIVEGKTDKINTCPTCKRGFANLGMHWKRKEEHRKDIDDEIMDILTGILMGDGTIQRRKRGLPTFAVQMTNINYLEWLDDRLGYLSNGVKLSRTEKQQAKSNRESGFRSNAKEVNYHDLYFLTVVSHPDISTFLDWYEGGEKRFPDDLELNPTILKHWYVTDGGLHWEGSKRSRASIASLNESDRSDYLQSLFEDIGIETSWQDHSNRIRMSCSETAKFLRYIGDPLPGFEYKWKNRRRNVYNKLKEESYDNGYEQEQKTLEELRGDEL